MMKELRKQIRRILNEQVDQSDVKSLLDYEKILRSVKETVAKRNSLMKKIIINVGIDVIEKFCKEHKIDSRILSEAYYESAKAAPKILRRLTYYQIRNIPDDLDIENSGSINDFTSWTIISPAYSKEEWETKKDIKKYPPRSGGPSDSSYLLREIKFVVDIDSI